MELFKYHSARIDACTFATVIGGSALALIYGWSQTFFLISFIAIAILIVTYFYSYKAFLQPATYWGVMKCAMKSCLLIMLLTAIMVIFTLSFLAHMDFISGFFATTAMVGFFTLLLMIPSLIFTWVMSSVVFIFYKLSLRYSE